jgi:prolycopene isomerase
VFTEVALLTEEQLSALDDVSVEEFLTRYEDLPGPLHSHFALMTNGLITSVPELVAMSELVRVQRSLSLPGPSGYPQGGYQRMFDNIAAAFKANGGEVQTRSKVERIIVEDSRVTGVATSDRIFKATIVISNAGIHPTVFKLVGEEHFDKSYVGYVRDLLPSLGFTSIRYILNRPVLPHALYWVTSEDSWLNLERLNKISAGEVPEEVSIYMTIPSNYDPGMAPPGKQMIVFGTWCSPNPEDREIKMLQRRTEELLVEVFPEIVPAIESKAGYTGPAQVSALTRDHVLPGQGGEAVGLAVTIGQCGKNKPLAKTPLPGLFYVGHDAGGSALMGTHQAMDSGIKVSRLARLYHLERKQAVL